ncbi:MAG: hypothetical protein RIF32_08680, partial [Leptospirales bacterium]
LRIKGVNTELVISAADAGPRDTVALTTVFELDAGDTVDTTIETAGGEARYLDPHSFSGHKF